MPSQSPAPNPYGSPGEPPAPNESGRRRTGLYLGLGTGLVVLLAVLGVTAFAYPGWLRDDHQTTKRPARASAPPRGPVDAGLTAEGTVNAALSRLNNGDLDEVGMLTCPEQRTKILRVIRTNDPRLTPVNGGDVADVDVDYELEAIDGRGQDLVVAEVSENFDNLPKSFRKTIPQGRFEGAFTLRRVAGRWQLCGVSFTIPGAPPSTDDTPDSPGTTDTPTTPTTS